MTPSPPPVHDAADPDAVAAAAAALRAAQIVVVPTDTVYGVAALASDVEAVAKLHAAKGRAPGQPVAVLIADPDDALDLALPPTAQVRGWMQRYWPGPLTLVLPRSARTADWDLGGAPSTIGVRCGDHPFVRALAAEVGPLATTSANRSGDPTPTDAVAAAETLGDAVSLVVDGGPAGTVASTVVDASGPEVRVLRAGALDPSAFT